MDSCFPYFFFPLGFYFLCVSMCDLLLLSRLICSCSSSSAFSNLVSFFKVALFTVSYLTLAQDIDLFFSWFFGFAINEKDLLQRFLVFMYSYLFLFFNFFHHWLLFSSPFFLVFVAHIAAHLWLNLVISTCFNSLVLLIQIP